MIKIILSLQLFIIASIFIIISQTRLIEFIEFVEFIELRVPQSFTPHTHMLSFNITFCYTYYLNLNSIIPSFQYSIIPTFHYSIIPIFHHSIIPIFHHSIIPTFHYSIIPLFHYSIPLLQLCIFTHLTAIQSRHLVNLKNILLENTHYSFILDLV